MPTILSFIQRILLLNGSLQKGLGIVLMIRFTTNLEVMVNLIWVFSGITPNKPFIPAMIRVQTAIPKSMFLALWTKVSLLMMTRLMSIGAKIGAYLQSKSGRSCSTPVKI